MNNRKTAIRFFTIADYENEEIWLRDQHKNGWKLSKMILPCFYIFEKCTPEDVVYRLDYKNNSENSNYFQLFSDYGWEYIGRCVGWLYFRKTAAEMNSEQENELFSDNESKIDMIDHITKTRLLPLMIIFFCCVFMNFIMFVWTSAPVSIVFTVFFVILTLTYIYLLVYCGLKLRKLRNQYRNN